MKRKYTVTFDDAKEKWILKHDVSGKVLKAFETKEDATRAGALRKTIGQRGGTVRIFRRNGAFEEERNFPPVSDGKA